MADEERVWERGWEGHRRAQRRRMANLTFDQKLEWLEQAHHLVLEFARARKLAESDRVREKPEAPE